MSEGQNKDLVREVIEKVWHAGNLSAIDVFFSVDYVNHDPDTPEAHDRSGYRTWASILRTAFPDLHVAIDDMVGEGDKVAKRWTATATHRGPLPGIPPSGKSVRFTGITIYRIQDGRIAECWWNKDFAGMLRQLVA